jgi:PAS domain S-box-containing protein
VTGGIAASIFLTGLLGFLSWQNTRQAAEDAAWVAHTHEVSTGLERALRHLDDVEAGGRGFALTGNQIFLEPYESGRSGVGEDLRALRALIVDPVQERNLERLAIEAEERIDLSIETVLVRKETGKEPSEAFVLRGKQSMDAARATIAEMEAEESRLLERRTQRARRAEHRSTTVILLGSILGSIFLALAGALVRREIAINARVRAQLSALNAELERRVAQRTADLESSEGRLSGIVQSAMDAIITTDDQQRILVFNKAAETMFRCSAAGTMGQPITRLIPERFHARHEGHFRKFAENGATTRAMGGLGAIWGIRGDGQEFQTEASISHIRVAGKSLLTVILRDISERVQAQAVRERLAAVVDSSDDAILSKDLQGIINAWNRGAERIFGYTAAEVMGKPMLMLFPPERVEEEADILARIARGESVEHFETVRVRKDGRRIDVSVTISPIRDARGIIVGASKIARDITERKLAERRLRESEENFRRLWNSMDEAFCTIEVLFDEDGKAVDYRFLEVNPAFAKHTGMENAQGRRIREIYPRQEESWYEILGEVARTGKAVRFEKEAAEMNRWFEVHAFRMGKVQERKVAILFNDISRRREQEKELRESEDRFRLFVEHAPAALAMFDREMGYLHWSRRWQMDYGLEGRDLRGVSHYQLFPEIPDRWKEVHRRVLKGEVLRGENDRFDRPDGSTQWIRWEARPWHNRRGEIGGIVIFAEEVTERKEAQDRLAAQAGELARQAEELLRSQTALEAQKLMLQSVLDSMEEGLVAADEEGKFILWNPAASQILGLGAANLASADWVRHYGLYREDTITPFPVDQLPLVRALGGESSHIQMFVRNPEMEEGIWIEVSGSPLKNKSGAGCGGVVAFRDVTQARAAEREIRQLNEELEEKVRQRTAELEAANRELESFTYSVSHDLRAPLRHIGGFSRILMEDFGPELSAEARRHLERIEEGVRRMGQLVDELLNLARVGRHALKLQPTRLNGVIEEVISMLQPEILNRKVIWKVAELPAAECDPVLIKQVFQNLMANALKFTRPREFALIEIESRQEAGGMVIAVRDNGVGFDMKYCDKLFGVFQRLHRAEEFEGTGIGLATVHRILQKHGGRIWAESELDKGATFCFSVEAAKAAAPEAESHGLAAGSQ